jgi:hypothetical protein
LTTSAEATRGVNEEIQAYRRLLLVILDAFDA